MRTIDLVMHDWLVQSDDERKQAIADLRAFAETAIKENHRRGRALNIMASFFELLSDEHAAAEIASWGDTMRDAAIAFIRMGVIDNMTRRAPTASEARVYAESIANALSDARSERIQGFRSSDNAGMGAERKQ